MRQIGICILAVLALLLPRGTDASELAPAQVVYVQVDGQTVTVRTDLGNIGKGKNLQEAFLDLNNTTPAKVFLDTADYLLINEKGISVLPELQLWLKGSCMVCVANEITDLQSAAEYLKAHSPELKLKDWSAGGMDLPLLTESDERFCLKS